jgi:hypothetical protein
MEEPRNHVAIAARLSAADSRFAGSVRPLYHVAGSSSPELIGCGVLLAIDEWRFILTAAHVMDEFDGRNLYLGATDTLVGVEGVAHRSEPPTGKSRDFDKTDAAVFQITSTIPEALNPHFLAVEALGVDAEPTDGRKYLVLGYVSSQSRVNRAERVVIPGRFRFVTNEASPDIYDRLEIAKFSHIALTFDRKRVTDGTQVFTAPKAVGLSGCGVWRFDGIWKESWEGRDKFVAILTEYRRPPMRVLVATRIAIHLAILSHHFPHLRSRVPVSRTTKIDLRR